MFRTKLFLLPVCLLQAILMIEDSNCMAAEEKTAVVFGAPAANLRVGAGIEHQIKAMLKEGDQVTVEKLEGEWYRVTVAEGQSGFVHKSLLKFADEASPSTSSSAASEASHAPNPVASTRTKPTASAGAPVSKDLPSATTGKSPSVLQMMEGHENEVMIAAAVGVGCFIIGWILGGRYYLRRDRARRRRIQF